jgi:hypothetical protein
MWPGLVAPNSTSADAVPPAKRRDLSHPGTSVERGKPVVSPDGQPIWESKPQGEPSGQRVKDEGESERWPVIGRIGVALPGNITPRRKPADFPLVFSHERALAN